MDPEMLGHLNVSALDDDVHALPPTTFCADAVVMDGRQRRAN
jgi:hypothetical protein